MSFVIKMKNKAISSPKRLVLAEGTDNRVIKAGRIILDERIAAGVTLLGKITDIEETAKREGVDLKGINASCPASDSHLVK
jgi:phosphate acetyltransferase